MILPSEEWRLDTRHIGRTTLLFDRLDSTNDYAASLAGDPQNDGVVVLARQQSAGRGQHGRSWQCPAGTGVLLSVLLFPPVPLRRPALLTAWAAVSVCETIDKVAGLPARIKWPNDVLIEGRKVCGILIEQGKATVAGMGLNVNQTAEDLAKAGLPLAGSVACLTQRALDCDGVARALIEQLDQEYWQLCQGCLSHLEERWKRQLGLLGQQVAMECADGTRLGRLRELGFEGLALEMSGGKHFRTLPENVRHMQAI
jgi:BirA family biotin operon repressor/biotin-[acetyl-CoA-carboxylase] ligase